jgi:acyl carrier protein
MSTSREEVSAVVIEVLAQLTEDWDLGGHTIGPSTALAADLGLSSIDVLTLMSRIDFRLGSTIDWEGVVVRDGRFVDDVTVDELVDYAVAPRGDGPAAPPKM